MKKPYPFLVLMGLLGASIFLNRIAEHGAQPTTIEETRAVVGWDTLLVLDAETGRENIHIISVGFGEVEPLK